MDQQTRMDMIDDSEWMQPRTAFVPWSQARDLDADAPRCITCMVNPCHYDGETYRYSDSCQRCFRTGTTGPRHLHVLKYWPAYVEAHKDLDPNVADHRWNTSHRSDSVFSAPGVQCGWYCTYCEEVQPLDGFAKEQVEIARDAMFRRFRQF